MVYTDDSNMYRSLEDHEGIKQSVGEYVNRVAQTNGVERFWAILKRTYIAHAIKSVQSICSDA